MRAGELKQRVIIQKPALVKNAIGEEEATWSTFATVWAAIEPATGTQYYQAKNLDSEVSGKIRIRYRRGILPSMRLTFGDRVFSIVSIVHPKENRQEIHIYYSESLD